MSKHPFDIIIGLEVHVQLQTRTKLFCRCSTQFGAPPNTQVCPVCLGLPGSLPVMNSQAFELAVKTAMALHCELAPFTKWDRKNYYYPDLPKGYQISQYDLPFSSSGYLDIIDPAHPDQTRRIGIIRAHLEEDAGKSLHDEIAGTGDSRIDLNRAGTPLVEIVSQPDLRSPAEAKTFLTDLKLLLSFLGVSDCNMQEGSLRVDANVNLHIHTPQGKIATPIVEVKNVNSFRAVERAMHYEVDRQYDEWESTGKTMGQVPKQTRGWDDVANVTRGQRHKEESSDYRYFPDPDLAPVRLSSAEIERLRASLGDTPAVVVDRLVNRDGLTPYDADVLVNQGHGVVAYYQDLATAMGDHKLASNWVQQEVLRWLKEKAWSLTEFPVGPQKLADLLQLIKKGDLDTTRAKEVLVTMVDRGLSAADAMQAMGIQAVDSAELLALCKELLQANPKIVVDLKNGVEKAAGSLVGQAKKKNPNVNPAQLRELCLKLAQEM